MRTLFANLLVAIFSGVVVAAITLNLQDIHSQQSLSASINWLSIDSRIENKTIVTFAKNNIEFIKQSNLAPLFDALLGGVYYPRLTLFQLNIKNNDQKRADKIEVYSENALYAMIERKEGASTTVSSIDHVDKGPIAIASLNPDDEVSLFIVTNGQSYDPVGQIKILSDNKKIAINEIRADEGLWGLTSYFVSMGMAGEILIAVMAIMSLLVIFFIGLGAVASSSLEMTYKFYSKKDLKRTVDLINFVKIRYPEVFKEINKK